MNMYFNEIKTSTHAIHILQKKKLLHSIRERNKEAYLIHINTISNISLSP